MMSTIPNEILDHIIHFIMKDTEPLKALRDLRALSLTCTSFVPLCQRQIFAEVQVDPRVKGGVNGQRLTTLLDQNSSLSTHIRCIIYRFDTSDPYTSVKETTCTPVFLHLPRIQHLKIASWYRPSRAIDLGEQENELFGPEIVLKRHLTSQTLTTLSLFDFTSLPMHDIISAPSLTTLILFNVTSLPMHDILSVPSLTTLRIVICNVVPSTTYLPPPANLRALETSAVKGDLFACFPDGTPLETLFYTSIPRTDLAGLSNVSKVFPVLKKLRVTHTAILNDDDTRATNRVFESTTGLECLAVEACGGGTIKPYDFRVHIRQCVMNNHTTLKRLHLYYKSELSSMMLWQGVYDVLEGVRGRNVIQEVDIIVFFDDRLSGSYSLSGNIVPTLEVWAKIDKLLAEDISQFPCLQKVSVCVVLRKDGPRDSTIGGAELAAFRNKFRRSFRHLTANPDIAFTGRVETNSGLVYYFPTIYTIPKM